MTTSVEREVERRLGEHDVRLTTGRLHLIRELARSDGPRSAAELHSQIHHEVPLSSLYRTLTVLEQVGVLTPHYSSQGITRYELAEWLRGHHHHFICVDCGAVEDVALPQALEARVQALVDEVGSLATFHARDHALEIEGLCARCG